MASSSSPASQRRRPLRKRQPLSRSNSSFLGTIKNLVTAPLAWFASTDEFENSKDLKGKRRRLVGAPTEPNIEDDDRTTRTKRMRVRSPSRDEPLSQLPSTAHHGYLDPPGSAFQQQQHRQPSPLNQPTFIRSASVTQPYDLSNNNSNFIRASTLSRTMSIDPPPRPLSSGPPMASIQRDTSMDSSSFIRTIPRDMSMPPLSARPSFRMRTSMTPQPPPPREVSEPPPLNTLVSNPTFVRAPQMKTSESMQGGLSRQASVTLGSLVDSVRSTRSPVRQHSSLLFGTSDERTSRSPRPENAIEKALHELDIYKTPLVPTRLRSSNVPATSSTSDLFKSRRSSHLVLMQDDKRTNRLGRKISGKQEKPLVNETKPYAGEGGMKKLLARRRQEADEETEDSYVQTLDDEDHMDDGVHKVDKKVTTRVEPAPAIPLPLSAKADFFSTNARSSSRFVTTSSLRVGRTKVRSHIARPARPSKTKFSAAYDDDDDDVMDDGEELDADVIQRKKEMEALEEAAKRAPIFQIPKGFTFANENKPIAGDSTNAKDPPIMSLPFSFAKPAPMPVNPPTQEPDAAFSSAIQSTTTPMSATQSTATSGPQFASAPVPEPSLAPPAPQRGPSPTPRVQPTEVPASVPAPTPTAPAPAAVLATSTSVPNFFAKSSALAKPLDIPEPAPLTFVAPSTRSPAASSFSLPAPLKDAENPLWEGESKRNTTTSTSALTYFGGFGTTVGRTAPSASSSQSGVFSNSSTSAIPVTSAPVPSTSVFGASAKLDEATAPVPQPLLFGGPPATTSTFSLSKPPPPVSSILFGGGAPKVTSPLGEAPASTVPAPSFGALQPSRFGEPPKVTTSVSESAFGNTSSERTGLFGEPLKTTTPAPAPFSFDQPVPLAPSPSEAPKLLFGAITAAVEAPRPLFGSGAFSFGNTGADTQAEHKPPSTPFSFGAAPSTPPLADSKKSTPFSFGALAPAVPTPAPAPVGFSFSGGGSNASDVSSKAFTFGQPATIALTARPSTPPKNQEQEVSMEESPTRDTQQIHKHADRPTLGGGSFAFAPSAPVSTFGSQSIGTSEAFSFGASPSSTNTFTKDNKPTENKPFGGFGQAAPSTAFGFGQAKPSDEPPRPSTTGSFPFGTSPSSATGPGPTFAFGGPGNTSTGSLFGQPQTTGSAPGSPSTFNQPSPFAFGAPLPPVNTAFSFGSQPASPAGGNHLSLPQPATPGGFGSTGGAGFGQPQPSSPFGAPVAGAGASAGGALFTIGSAPAPAPVGGARQIRKLPNRRGGAKR